MRIGPSRIVKCPFCGAEKKLVNLLSGNNFGATCWSDNKVDAPMMRRVSPVQQCFNCDKYYLLSRQRERYDRNGIPSVFTGELSYPKAVKAYRQLKGQGFRISRNVRIMLLHAYNDYFYRDRAASEHVPTEDDVRFIHEILLWLAKRWAQNDLLRAELYREAGLMEKAIKLLTDYEPEKQRYQVIKDEILRRAHENDTSVFKVECSLQRRYKTQHKKKDKQAEPTKSN